MPSGGTVYKYQHWTMAVKNDVLDSQKLGCMFFVSEPDGCSKLEVRNASGHYLVIWYQEVSDLTNSDLEFLVGHFTARCT